MYILIIKNADRIVSVIWLETILLILRVANFDVKLYMKSTRSPSVLYVVSLLSRKTIKRLHLFFLLCYWRRRQGGTVTKHLRK